MILDLLNVLASFQHSYLQKLGSYTSWLNMSKRLFCMAVLNSPLFLWKILDTTSIDMITTTTKSLEIGNAVIVWMLKLCILDESTFQERELIIKSFYCRKRTITGGIQQRYTWLYNYLKSRTCLTLKIITIMSFS